MAQLFSSEMTASKDDGYLLIGVGGVSLFSTEATNPGTSGATVYKYKNRGWYVAGGVEESWVTVGAPSTVPPSGHTLIGIDYVVLQP
jgi:hypothetical protein